MDFWESSQIGWGVSASGSQSQRKEGREELQRQSCTSDARDDDAVRVYERVERSGSAS